MRSVVIAVKGSKAAVLFEGGELKYIDDTGYKRGQILDIPLEEAPSFSVIKGKSKRHFSSLRLPSSFAAAASVLLLTGAVTAYAFPVSTVTIDVNPSLSLGINLFDRIVSADYANEDGEELLKSISPELLGKRLPDGVNIVFDEMERRDFIGGRDIPAASTVESRFPGRRDERIMDELRSGAEHWNEIHNDRSVSFEVERLTPDLKKEADDFGLTPGQYMLQRAEKAAIPDLPPEADEAGKPDPLPVIPGEEINGSGPGSDADPEASPGDGKDFNGDAGPDSPDGAPGDTPDASQDFGGGAGPGTAPEIAPDASQDFSGNAGPGIVPGIAPDASQDFSGNAGPGIVPDSVPDASQDFSGNASPGIAPGSVPDIIGGSSEGSGSGNVPESVPWEVPSPGENFSGGAGAGTVPGSIPGGVPEAAPGNWEGSSEGGSTGGGEGQSDDGNGGGEDPGGSEDPGGGNPDGDGDHGGGDHGGGDQGGRDHGGDKSPGGGGPGGRRR